MRFPCSCTPQGTSSGFWIVVVIVVLLTLLMTSAMEGEKDEDQGDTAIGSPGSHDQFDHQLGPSGYSVHKSAVVGSSRVLECEVKYPQGAYVQHIVTWRKQGLEAPIFILFDDYPPRMDASFHGRIRIIGQASIEIADIRERDEGWYECSVLFLDEHDDRNNNGTWIYLAVHSPPVLGDVSPSLLMRSEGDTVDIFCEATGSPVPTVVWLKDGRELMPTERLTIARNKVVVRDIGKEDAGIYACSFKNTAGAVVHHVKLVIQGNGWISSGGSAYITHPPRNATVIEGSKVRLQCQAEGFPDNITYRWYHDGVDFQLITSLAHRSRLLSDGTLVIDSVTKGDRGWYKCRPTNDLGTPPEAEAYLNVTYLPRVIDIPSQLYLARGMLGRIDCPVDSNPPLTMVVWSKGKRQVNVAHQKHVRVNKHGTLILRPVTNGDEGVYSCTPYSPLGKGDSSTPVQVFVRDPPYFTLLPKPFYQRQQTQSVTMPCSADGYPKPVITWRKADGMLPAAAKLLSSGGNLTIVNLGREDEGVYECIAANPVSGIITTTLVIVELTTPHPPYNVTVRTTHNSARISWAPAYDTGFPLHYVIWYRIGGLANAPWTTVRVVSNDVTSIIIHQLTPNTFYDVMVLSRNRIGDALFSNVVSAKTKSRNFNHSHRSTTVHPGSHPFNGNGGLRPSKPRNVTVRQHRQGLLVSWVGSPRGSQPPVDYYIVQYRTVGQWVPLSGRITDGATSFNWTTASRGATYHFRVFSYHDYKKDDDGSGDSDEEEEDREPASSLPSDVITIHTGDPMNEGMRISDEAIGAAIGGLFLLGVALVTVLAAVKYIKSWRKKRKLLKGCHMVAGQCELNPEPMQSDTQFKVASENDKGPVKETPI